MQKRAGRAPSGQNSRLKPVEQDPLAEYGLPSKGEKRLLSHKVQEAYYGKIVERYLAFCTRAGDRDGLQKQFARLSITSRVSSSSSPEAVTPLPSAPLPPAPASAAQGKPISTIPPSDDLAQILAALRKLREGLVASHRRDDFSTQAFLFSARLGILAGSYETYYPSLLHLLRRQQQPHRSQQRTSNPAPPPSSTARRPTSSSSSSAASLLSQQPTSKPTTTTTTNPPPPSTHPNPNPTTTPPSTSSPTPPGTLTSLERTDLLTYLLLDTACRRCDLASAYALRHTHNFHHPTVDAALHALARDDWVSWRRVCAREADGYRAALLAMADERMARHVLRAVGRAYLGVERGVLEGWAGYGWGELKGRFGVGWEVEGDGEGEGGGKDGGGNGGRVMVVVRRVGGKK